MTRLALADNLDLRAGKLEQACPDCGLWEAAGSYCSKCYRRMGPDDWYPNGDLERRAVARVVAPQKSQTPGKGGRGRPRASSSAPASHRAVDPTLPVDGPRLDGAPLVGSEDAANGAPPSFLSPVVVPPTTGDSPDTLGL